jgi:membrane-associated protease RseP (regulator of RpoE activity)
VTRRDALIHGGLFLACCVTTTIAGALSSTLMQGIAFGATLMTILTCHELGHYIAGRYHGVDVSLPYFIPMPPIFTLGTLGAVIRMRKPIEDRRKLFDVGAAGPIAGLVVAIPLLIIGLHLSELAPQKPGDNIEGNSILYALL